MDARYQRGENAADQCQPKIVGAAAALGVMNQVAPWKHRSEGMRCKTCMWFAPKEAALRDRPGYDVGRCRRHAPTMGGYPVVFVNDWCGDHRLNENAI